MTQMYRILTIAGWAWLVCVAVFLVIRFTIMRKHTRGFEVAPPAPLRPPPPADESGGR